MSCCKAVQHDGLLGIRTRPSQTGSEHDPITEQAVQSLLTSGGLSWHWKAHGFHYGIAVAYALAVKAGHLVVVNGSRAHVNDLIPAEDVKVIEVSASADKLATRLKQRGRDDLQAIAGRLVRNASLGPVKADKVIANDGSLSASGQQLADYLIATAQLIKQ
jgi:ribose 1,5-bisphosphokinase